MQIAKYGARCSSLGPPQGPAVVMGPAAVVSILSIFTLGCAPTRGSEVLTVATAQGTPPTPALAARAVLDQYCVGCHNE